MQRRTIETLIALLVIATLFGVLMVKVILVKDEIRPQPPQDFGPIPVGVRPFEAGVDLVGIEVSGNLAPARRLVIRAETGGRVVAALAPWRAGTGVGEGDLLFEVDGEPARLALVVANGRIAEARAAAQAAAVDVAAAEASIPVLIEVRDAARRLRKRLEGLVHSGETSANAVDNALVREKQADVALQEARSAKMRGEALVLVRAAGVKSAEALADQARDARARLAFRAPFKGLLVGDGPELGGLLVPGSPLGELVDLSSLRLVVQVHESELAGIRAGAQVKVTLPSRPGFVANGVVERIAPIADLLTRSFAVEISVTQDPKTPLPAGSFARASVAPVGAAHLAEALLIQRHEFVWKDGKPIAFVFNDGVVQARPLQLGRTIGDGFLVLDGLTAGETLVLEPLDRMNANGGIDATLKP